MDIKNYNLNKSATFVIDIIINIIIIVRISEVLSVHSKLLYRVGNIIKFIHDKKNSSCRINLS